MVKEPLHLSTFTAKVLSLAACREVELWVYLGCLSADSCTRPAVAWISSIGLPSLPYMWLVLNCHSTCKTQELSPFVIWALLQTDVALMKRLANFSNFLRKVRGSRSESTPFLSSNRLRVLSGSGPPGQLPAACSPAADAGPQTLPGTDDLV